MITVRELQALSAEWGLTTHVIEKDWALGWVLAGIGDEPALSTWVFKGGTSLRKCYYETYRFSEDLDFTVIEGGPAEPGDVGAAFTRVADWVRDSAGLELVIDASSFRAARNTRGNATIMGKIAYRGPTNPPTLPKLKVDATSDELVPGRPILRRVLHPYTDAANWRAAVACYSIVDLMAEKMRALAQRCRPRDLYDVVFLFRHPDLLGRASEVRSSLAAKCDFVGIDYPTIDSTRSTPFRDEVEAEWSNMLNHQLPSLPPFEHFWEALDDVFGWLEGTSVLPTLARAAQGPLDETWTAPRSMVSWGTEAPMEMIRLAGANRLKVEIDYRPEEGRHGVRLVEPYSFRRTREGHLVLFVVNDRGELRSYRVDRIARVAVTRTPFRPRYAIEF
ncbi:MAG: nucleotidyl transferase AbiEii/AbiGii toxin family protein [Actinomycetales bacterium]|nr:nucleotidyl transferase AbiEii/AbiGii toxin family protein [Actinomycetales bacterium]